MNGQHNKPIVLVVDDSPDSLGMINKSLDDAGYTVLVALGSEQALNITGQIKPDVVLMDAIMPAIDGFECCIRMRKVLPLTPIIFMTGLTEVEHTVKAFECGGNDYITKPVNPQDLLARISAHLHNARMIDNARAALDIAKQYILAVDNAGHILWSTPDTQELLQTNKLDTTTSNERFAAALGNWINDKQRKNDLVLHAGVKPLTIRYFKAISSNEHLLRIVEHEAILDASVLAKNLPITKRESEVLLWIAHGKSNREIAEILSLSPRTVNKHLEQIYSKIQVDNRTAAASIAIQSLLGLPV